MNSIDQRSTLVFDACSILNLYASRWMQDILRSTLCSCHIASIVRDESQFVLKGGSGEDASELEAIDLIELIRLESLTLAEIETEEEALHFVDLSTRLADGEAMTIALAVMRGWTVVTDDRKAGRVSQEMGTPVLSSLDLLRIWAEHGGIEKSILREVFRDIRYRARWEPPRRHPHRNWWEEMFDHSEDQ